MFILLLLVMSCCFAYQVCFVWEELNLTVWSLEGGGERTECKQKLKIVDFFVERKVQRNIRKISNEKNIVIFRL